LLCAVGVGCRAEDVAVVVRCCEPVVRRDEYLAEFDAPHGLDDDAIATREGEVRVEPADEPQPAVLNEGVSRHGILPGRASRGVGAPTASLLIKSSHSHPKRSSLEFKHTSSAVSAPVIMRIGIVNDLSLAREALRRLVLSVPGNSVAWVAYDGDIAVQKVASDRPDVVLMDLVMPRLNGVEATRRIMRESPCPVLVVTATIPGHYDMVIQAMGAGALDAVETPTFSQSGPSGEKLLARLEKLKAAISGNPGSSIVVPSRPAATGLSLPPLVVVGASTGGPDALATVLAALPANFPAAVLVAQHIGAEFVPGLVQQLAIRSQLAVRVAQEGDRPAAGTVLVAASNDHLEVTPHHTLRYTPVPRSCASRPSGAVATLPLRRCACLSEALQCPVAASLARW